MKAIVLKDFGGIENFELADMPLPGVKDNEALIKIRATAFNPIDYQMRQGSTESKLLKSPVLGRECSGEIISLGPCVETFRVGDKVSAYVGSLASNGTYATHISIPVQLLAKNPASLSFEQAAALPMAGMTALQCLKRVTMPKDKAIGITGGAGGVGTILIKLLLAYGHQHIYTTAGNADSIGHLKQLGLPEDHIIDYKRDDVLTAMRTRSKLEHFGYIIDLVGGPLSETFAALLDVFGTYVDVTQLTTAHARETLFDKAATIVNIANYAPALKSGTASLAYYGDALGELFDKIERQLITPAPVDVLGNFSVATVQQAHLMMEQNQAKGKKLVMVMD